MSYPSYLRLAESGELARRAEEGIGSLRSCAVCPRRCRVNRLEGELGICRTGRYGHVSSYFAHFGEEHCLSGWNGSGTLFFSGCSLLCAFCQNYEISHCSPSDHTPPENMAGMMLRLQESGCHHLNLVTPSHVVPQFLEALVEAVSRGLTLPIVYNSSGYDSVETLRSLDGIVDIFMPDLKFSEPDISSRYADAPDYFDVAQKALREMHRQVGDLTLSDSGIAVRGLLVRHLVMPCGTSGTGRIVRFLAEEISPGTCINVMRQYRPAGEAFRFSELSRPVSCAEFNKAVALAEEAGLKPLKG